MPRWVRVLAITVVAVGSSGCVGATDRADFDDEVRARGGGITTDWVDASIRAVARELDLTDAGDLEFLTLSINGTSRTVTITGRRGDRPDFVDSITVREGDVVSVAPIQDADQFPLDEITISIGDVSIDDIELLIDAALADFGEVDAYVTTITVALTNGEPTTTLGLESSRRTGTAVFDSEGTLQRTPQ